MVKEGFKQTEIGVIPRDWEVRLLNDACIKLASGKSNTKGILGGIYPIYGSTGVIGQKDYYDYDGDKITVARVGANAGKINRISGYYCISDNTLFVQLYNEVDIDFIYNFLESINLNKYIFGSGQPLITGSILKNLSIPLPPLPEQKAIANALSDADAWIENLEQCISKKRLIKQGAMQDLLSPKEDWEGKKLGDLTQLITKGTTPTSVGFEFEDSGVNFIKIESITKSGKILRDKIAYITSQCNEVLSRSKIFEGDILFSIAGALGRTAIVKKDIIPANTNQALAIIRLKEGIVSTKFLYYFFNDNSFQNMLNTISVTGAQPNLSLQNINEFEINLPKSITEQTRIATILSDMDNEIESLENKLKKARQIKQGMMQELLTGRVRLV